MGITERRTSETGRLKRYEDMYRFRPIGGVRYPISRFTRKIMPRWMGSTPKARPMGIAVHPDGSTVFVTTGSFGKLFFLDPRTNATTGDLGVRVRRYSYSPTSGTYTQDAGFPLDIGIGGIEAVVIDKDSTGVMWATWTQSNGIGGRQVMVTHGSPADDRSWVPPFVLPAAVRGCRRRHARRPR